MKNLLIGLTIGVLVGAVSVNAYYGHENNLRVAAEWSDYLAGANPGKTVECQGTNCTVEGSPVEFDQSAIRERWYRITIRRDGSPIFFIAGPSLRDMAQELPRSINGGMLDKHMVLSIEPE